MKSTKKIKKNEQPLSEAFLRMVAGRFKRAFDVEIEKILEDMSSHTLNPKKK